MQQFTLLWVALCAAFSTSQAFVPTGKSSHVQARSLSWFVASSRLYYSPPSARDDNNEDEGKKEMPRDEELIGSTSSSSSSSDTSSVVDWDAEWKKVVRDQKAGKKVERPGEGYYKSEAEIKAIQAANKARLEAAKVTSSLPTWQMLKGDWKVCTCTLRAI